MKSLFTRGFHACLILLLIPIWSYSSHIVGGNFEWQNAGKDSFEVSLTLYRDCHGVNLELPDFKTQCKKNGKALNPKVTFINQEKEDITPVCQNNCSACNDNCSRISQFAYGIQKVKATYLVDLSSISCCQVEFVYDNCCRSRQITTGPARQNFYLTSWLDLCKAPKQNSPSFGKDPVSLICNNDHYNYNHGVSLNSAGQKHNPDNDSLTFNLVKPLKAANQSVQYNSSYNFKRPLHFKGFPRYNAKRPKGFHLNNQTGTIRFTPQKANQVSLVAFGVKKFKNGKPIARVTRDMQINVLSCPNNQSPKISGLDCSSGNTNVAVCQADTAQFSTCVTDPNPKDSVSVYIDKNAIPGKLNYTEKQINRNKKRLNFTWMPGEESAKGTYPLFLEARDSRCPVKGISSRKLSLQVKPRPAVNIEKHNLQCNLFEIKSTLKANSPPVTNHEWRINQKVESTFRQFYYEAKEPGSYGITLNTQSTECRASFKDTLEVDNRLKFDLGNDTTLCSNSSINLGIHEPQNKDSLELIWHDGQKGTHERRFANLKSDTSIALTLRDANCSYTDTVAVDIKPRPQNRLIKQQYKCQSDTLKLTFNQSDHGSKPFVKTANKEEAEITWAALSKDNAIFHEDSTYSFPEPGQYVLTSKDKLGCTDTDTLRLENLPLTSVKSDPLNFCRNKEGSLKVDLNSPLPTGWDVNHHWESLTKQSHSVSGPKIDLKPTDTVAFKVKTQFKKDQQGSKRCSILDTVKKQVFPNPTINIDSVPDLCSNGAPVNLDQFSSPDGGKWKINNSPIKGNELNPTNLSSGNHAMTYVYKNDKGCKNWKTVTTYIEKPPKAEAGPDTILCASNKSIKLNGAPELPNAKWKGPGVKQRGNNWYFNPNASQVDSGANHLAYIIPSTSINHCMAIDSQLVKVIRKPYPDQVDLCPGDTSLESIFNNTSQVDNWQIKKHNVSISQGVINNESGKLRGSFPLLYKVEEHCANFDTTILTYHDKPQIHAIDGNPTSFCALDNDYRLKANPDDGLWKGKGVKQSAYFNPQKAGSGKHDLTYLRRDPATGCQNKKSLTVSVDPSPKLSIEKTEKAFCENQDEYSFTVKHEHAEQIEFATNEKSSGSGFQKIEKGANQLKGLYHPSESQIAQRRFRIKAKANGAPKCPIVRDSIEVSVSETPNSAIKVNEKAKGCAPLNLNLEADLLNPQKLKDPAFAWEIGKKHAKGPTANLRLSKEGQHAVRLITTSANGCRDTILNPNIVKVYPKPKPDFESDVTTTTPSEKVNFANLTDSSFSELAYLWELDNNIGNKIEIQEWAPSLRLPDTGQYDVKLTATNKKGCQASLKRTDYIDVKARPIVHIPNAFSPDGDGKNDQFRVQLRYVKAFELTILNRWGETVYTSRDYQNHGWDGRFQQEKAPVGNYLYRLKVKGFDKNWYDYSGSLNLIR